MSSRDFILPQVSLRFYPVWRRHWLVWKKIAAASIMGHLADPVIYMLGLGYGLGSLLPNMGGMSYMAFLAAGTVCYSTMNSASFEALYSGFSRMHEQRTWEAILNTPISLDDVVLAEILWAATKSLMSGVAVLVVIWLLGLSHSLMSLWMIPLALLIGLTFAAIGLIMTALAPAYDFFMYYFTLFITPMMLMCGVFFPVNQLPESVQIVAGVLPLTHAVDLARPLMNGNVPESAVFHISVLLAYTLTGFYLSLVLFRRRLSR
jgi:lipooligosaccharide transport system permease protein